jgi:hypothetical protein
MTEKSLITLAPGHISVVTSPFLTTNQVKLKSENFRTKKRPPAEDDDQPSNIVINLYPGDVENDRKNNIERQEGVQVWLML